MEEMMTQQNATESTPVAPKKYSKPTLKIMLTALATALVAGGGMYFFGFYQGLTSTQDEITQMREANEAAVLASGIIIGFNCEQSGGAFSNNTCTCSGELTYDEKTGYCQTEIGSPGGQVMKQIQAGQELTIIKNTIVSFNCEQSGGTFDGEVCTCPVEFDEQLDYDVETGYCVSDFGTPGGQLGESVRAAQASQNDQIEQ